MRLDAQIINEIVHSIKDNQGIDLVNLSDQQPTLLFFLRHFGCTFCREALSDLSEIKTKINTLGVQLVFVHMVDKETADMHLSFYELNKSVHISDPEKRLYEYFGLKKGNIRQLYGLNVMMRGLKAGLLDGHGHGFTSIGDMNQMPGLFMLHHQKVIRSFLHDTAADKPDYLEFITLALENNA